MKYKFLEHTADAKFVAYGKNIEEAFSNAALAMVSIITDTEKVKSKEKHEIKVQGKDEKALLYNFLEEILFFLDAKHFLLHKVEKIEIKNNKLIAVVSGDSVQNYKTSGDIKAVTYNDMEIKKIKEKVSVQVVVDL